MPRTNTRQPSRFNLRQPVRSTHTPINSRTTIITTRSVTPTSQQIELVVEIRTKTRTTTRATTSKTKISTTWRNSASISIHIPETEMIASTTSSLTTLHRHYNDDLHTKNACTTKTKTILSNWMLQWYSLSVNRKRKMHNLRIRQRPKSHPK